MYRCPNCLQIWTEYDLVFSEGNCLTEPDICGWEDKLEPYTGIDVIVYKPFKAKTVKFGHVAAAYRLALLVMENESYLIDEFGVGTINSLNDLNNQAVYNMPVYLVNPDDDITPNFRDLIIGIFPLEVSNIFRYLEIDCTQDLAQFIQPGDDCTQRFNCWVALYRKERNHVAG